MTKLLVPLSLALALAACGQPVAPGGGLGGGIGQIQQGAVAACSFLPTAASVTALLTANPALATASAAINAICKVAGAKTLRKKVAGQKVKLNVKGVDVYGEYVAD
jgi:hypothetical protein